MTSLMAKVLCPGGGEAAATGACWRRSSPGATYSGRCPTPWPTILPRGTVTLDLTYRVFAPDAWLRIKDIIHCAVTSGLIYLPS
jgi:hypothetical protein